MNDDNDVEVFNQFGFAVMFVAVNVSFADLYYSLLRKVEEDGVCVAIVRHDLRVASHSARES